MYIFNVQFGSVKYIYTVVLPISRPLFILQNRNLALIEL